jgi:glyoxylase-like metal-dependent hydrolase (beta-lactamase superfamily II)
MRRVFVLAALITAGILSQGAMWIGCPAKPSPKVATIERFRGNLYVVKGGGGNTAVLVTDVGVVVVDTKLFGWGPEILDRIRSVTDKPVTTIINTHTHGDHVGSNQFFDTAVEIVAHANTKRYMQTEMEVFAGENARFLPNRTFADRLSVTSGKDEIDLYYFGAGHTDGDAIVVFPALHTAHVGDLFAGKTPPVIDAVHGGSGVAYPETLSKAYATIKDVDSIITGHSTEMTWDDLRSYADFNRDFLGWTMDQMTAGRSAEDAAAMYRLPAKYKGYDVQPWVVKSNMETIVAEVRKPATPVRRWLRGT